MVTSATKEIRNLFVVLGSGIVAALLVALLLLYYYNPTGRYYARNVLLDPQLTAQLSYMDTNPKTGGSSLFIYDSVEYSYFDAAVKRWQQQIISQEAYGQFYKAVSDDRSLASVPEDVVALFNQPLQPHLVIKVKTKSDSEWQSASKTFIEVQLLTNSDYYRIQLRSNASAGNWAYFKHPQLLEELQKLLIRP